MPTKPTCPEPRRRCLRALAAALASAWGTGAHGAVRNTIRLSHVVARDTPKGMALEHFAQKVEERSQGRIRVQIFPQGELYGDHDEMQALQLGAVDMVAPSLSKFGPVGFPEFELFDLPFLFDRVEAVRRLTRGTVGNDLLQGLRRQGLLGLGFFDNGFKQLSANRPLLEPRDFVGQRMRVQASRVIAQQMRAWGAWPVVLPFSETRRALETGVVDGTENPLSNFWTQGMQAVQSDVSLTAHGYLGYAVVTHQRFWNHLAWTDQTLVRDALDEALAYGNAIADAHNNKALVALRQSHATRIHVPTEHQLQRLKQASQPVHAAFAARMGPMWLQGVKAELQRLA
ncbi:MAG: DctP family TRAP transporter solute-binding subunit [Rhodoferax sp.]|nr:DctP family TRAP transporter solute-binding subunit [Rhodoferax sp.]